MSIQLNSKQLMNPQQMEVAIHGPDGATHLIICTGVADLGLAHRETYTFLVGPQLSQRQFVGVIASGALAVTQIKGESSSAEQTPAEDESHLILVRAGFEEGSNQVRVSVEIYVNKRVKLAISYNVNILAELPGY